MVRCKTYNNNGISLLYCIPMQLNIHCIHPLFLDPILFIYLVQMLVDEGDQRLLDDHQLVRGVVEQRVEGVPLAAHAHVIVAAGQLLGDDAVGEDALALGDDHHVHHHVLGEADGGAEVPGEGDQEVEDGHDVLGVDGLDTPPGLVPLQPQHAVSDSQDNPEKNDVLLLILIPAMKWDI